MGFYVSNLACQVMDVSGNQVVKLNSDYSFGRLSNTFLWWIFCGEKLFFSYKGVN